MNNCHPSIRSILLPIHPLDSEAPDEGFSHHGDMYLRRQTPHPSAMLRIASTLSHKGRGKESPAVRSALQPRHRHAVTGQLIGALVFVVAGVALDPVPAQLMLF